MPRPQQQPIGLTPGQAQYVLDRLLADRRIAPAEITRYVSDMQHEIVELEARIARLREASGTSAPTAAPFRAPQAPPPATRAGRKRRRRTGNPLAGSYMGYMRQVKSASKKSEFKKIKEERGFADAIAAIKQHLGK
jgi:hypothetical protein